jgi:hypothetical protein
MRVPSLFLSWGVPLAARIGRKRAAKKKPADFENQGLL